MSETAFQPASVWARSGEFICFVLAPGVGTHHTVTLRPEDCNTRFTSLCDQSFEDPRDRMAYQFSADDDYSYYDRFHPEMTGTMHISASDPTVPPSSPTSTSSTTTTTTAPSTTTSTAPTTTTTAPTSIHPFLIPDPTTTTTTAVATTGPPPPTTAPANKDTGKDKAKKAASPSTPTTAAPAPPDAMPPDSVFDPAALTPGPTVLPAPDGSNSEDEAAIDASAAASLLDPQKASDDGGKLLLMALGALTMLLLLCGGWAWFTRSSQYDPA